MGWTELGLVAVHRGVMTLTEKPTS